MLTVIGENFGEDLHAVWTNRQAELGPMDNLIDEVDLMYNHVMLSSMTEALEMPCIVQTVSGPPFFCAVLATWYTTYNVLVAFCPAFVPSGSFQVISFSVCLLGLSVCSGPKR